MSANSEQVERIVREVLSRLGASTEALHQSNGNSDALVLNDRVLTGDILAARIGSADQIQVAPNTVLTPTAKDYIRQRNIEVTRQALIGPGPSPITLSAVVVDSTPALDRLIQDESIETTAIDCPDAAAEAAAAAVSNREADNALLFAAWTHRCAMVANRNPSARAAVASEAAEIASIRKTMKANIWCIDPVDRGYFELRNIVRGVAS